MSEPTLCCRTPGAPGGYCIRCDLLVGLEGLHVIAVERDDGRDRPGLTITVESAPGRWAAHGGESSRTHTAGSRSIWSTPRRWADR
ncbi:hypothetical protein V3N99_08210 [Dermatophilaceae bacterium Soc4.6]